MATTPPSKDRRLARNGGVLVLASAALIAFIGDWEDKRKPDGSTDTVVYADRLAKGLPTVGCYGITKHVTGEPVIVGDVWSHERCERVLGEALQNPQYGILNCISYKGLTQNQFDAFSSFAWNVGVTAACGSRAAGLMDEGRVVEACNAISRTPAGKPNWSNSGGVFVQGLYNRRLAETKMCLVPSVPAIGRK